MLSRSRYENKTKAFPPGWQIFGRRQSLRTIKTINQHPNKQLTSIQTSPALWKREGQKLINAVFRMLTFCFTHQHPAASCQVFLFLFIAECQARTNAFSACCRCRCRRGSALHHTPRSPHFGAAHAQVICSSGGRGCSRRPPLHTVRTSAAEFTINTCYCLAVITQDAITQEAPGALLSFTTKPLIDETCSPRP